MVACSAAASRRSSSSRAAPAAGVEEEEPAAAPVPLSPASSTDAAMAACSRHMCMTCM